VVLFPVLLAVVAAISAPRICYQHPVTAPVAERFDAPACRWCPGNRGLDYATRFGETVRAAGPGHVVFAGPVAGRRWLTVAHADGLRTSYGPLAATLVRSGTTVSAGQAIGRAAGRLHVGVRRGEQYLDPATIFGPAVQLRPRLVPLDGPAPPRPLPRCLAAERSRPVIR
jgi:murein DD-endopeptidase MepM/ murein hydrolase activator NlpD